MQANYKAENQIQVPSGVISVNHSPFAIPVQKTAMVKSCYKTIPFGNCHVQILRREEVILTSSPVPWKRERAWRWGTYLALLLSEAVWMLSPLQLGNFGILIQPQNLSKCLWSEMTTMPTVRAAWIIIWTSTHVSNRTGFNKAVPILRNSTLPPSKHVTSKTWMSLYLFDRSGTYCLITQMSNTNERLLFLRSLLQGNGCELGCKTKTTVV